MRIAYLFLILGPLLVSYRQSFATDAKASEKIEKSKVESKAVSKAESKENRKSKRSNKPEHTKSTKLEKHKGHERHHKKDKHKPHEKRWFEKCLTDVLSPDKFHSEVGGFIYHLDLSEYYETDSDSQAISLGAEISTYLQYKHARVGVGVHHYATKKEDSPAVCNFEECTKASSIYFTDFNLRYVSPSVYKIAKFDVSAFAGVGVAVVSGKFKNESWGDEGISYNAGFRAETEKYSTELKALILSMSGDYFKEDLVPVSIHFGLKI